MYTGEHMLSGSEQLVSPITKATIYRTIVVLILRSVSDTFGGGEIQNLNSLLTFQCRNTKIKVSRTIVMQMLLNCLEVWPLTKGDLGFLETRLL